MESQSEMPTHGQFVAVWVHNGQIWSETYKWFNDELKRYWENDGYDGYEIRGDYADFLKRVEARFIV